MLAHNDKDNAMEIPVGRVVTPTAMKISGEWHYVMPTCDAALFFNYHRNWLTKLADNGELIATKRGGSWWFSLGLVGTGLDLSVHEG